MQLTSLLDQIHQGSSISWPTAPAGPAARPPVPGAAGSPVTPAARASQEEVPCQVHDDADLWFAERAAEVERAKALCRPCPVRDACLAGAQDRGEPWGVWGGEVFVDGVVVARKRGRGRPRKDAAA